LKEREKEVRANCQLGQATFAGQAPAKKAQQMTNKEDG